MSRRGFLCTFLLACWIAAPVTGAVEKSAKRNVLFLVVDDVNDWVGCLDGHPNAQTPNIDRLARRGMLFTNAHCQAPICGPSRASIFTGLLPSTSGIYLQMGEEHIRECNEATRRCTFLPNYFEQHGYATLGGGKLYHRGDATNSFQVYGSSHRGGPRPKERFKYDPAWFGKPAGTSTDWAAFPEADEEMPDFQTAAWAVKALEEERDEPFFLGVGFFRPHVPWYVPQKWFDEHPIEDVQTPPFLHGDQDDVPLMSRRVHDIPKMPTTGWAVETGQWADMVQAYLACSTFADAQVGKVLDALEKSPYAESTVIVLWSDHGYHLGEKDRFAKHSLWERATRVPLIVAGPGIAAGWCDRSVGLIDMYPTLVELCGLPANDQNEGHSLVPLLKDPQRDWPYAALTTYGRNNHAVRGLRYRYIRYEDGSEELYDHQNDPNEWQNLAGDDEYANVIEEHQKHLPKINAALAERSSYPVNDYFIERMPAWRGR